MELLRCTRCGEEKPADRQSFPPHKNKSNGLDSWCRACRSQYRKSNRFPPGVTDLAAAREARSIEECVICGTTQNRRLAIDHSHASGRVRGALCNSCNLGLGHFRDDPELLRFAALYLEGRCACGKCSVRWGGGESPTCDQATAEPGSGPG